MEIKEAMEILEKDIHTEVPKAAISARKHAREMGMTEDEFFHSCPVFFCEQYEIFREKKAREVRTLYGR